MDFDYCNYSEYIDTEDDNSNLPSLTTHTLAPIISEPNSTQSHSLDDSSESHEQDTGQILDQSNYLFSTQISESETDKTSLCTVKSLNYPSATITSDHLRLT